MHTHLLFSLTLTPLPPACSKDPILAILVLSAACLMKKPNDIGGCTCLKARKRAFVNHSPNINIGFNRGFSGALAGVHLAMCITSCIVHFQPASLLQEKCD